ncbi:hypothetical protein MUN82_06530 [Hymenobacter aerilatus]|uniref:Uncharacterized protein n=1 Tax=Hymenobacter aerilatus TaxID=2932251 RepID=A0A8T9SZC9_9BACT|nr:hypothetical protein [Hymenobacter aerilatus]UOR06751.1 hypothetical protein MUN82_06530 [Hymenobacter aerilatus]
MMGLKTALGWLDLQPGTVGIEINNPFFQFDAVPGVTTYPFSLPMTPGNLRKLNFPHVRAAQGEQPAPESVEFYVDGVLWRVGSLLYQEHQPDKQLLVYKFAAGADDLQARIEGVTLASLDLGTVPLVRDLQQPTYALRRLRNEGFYGDKYPLWAGYLNDVGVLSPQPRWVPLLRQLLASVGYTVAGDWLTSATAQQLAIYSDRAAEDEAGNPLSEVALNQFVPSNVGVGAALVAMQTLFGLGLDFDTVRRQLRLVPLREVAEDDAYLVREPGVLTRALPSQYQGYTLEFGLEADELSKTEDISWSKLVIDGGKEVITTEAGALHTFIGGPAVVKRGASPARELGNESRCGLRFLFDRDDQLSGGLVLRWAGEQGLYEQCHKPWLDLLARAGTEERTMPFRVADLLALNPARKEMVGPRKYLWEKVSVTVSTSTRLQSARFTYRHVRR